ncbi:hypothetical protein P5673_025728 [Acropora cervicornis]|uniref:Uncharacterized protein n=1 Tax=Acropora cervicornis TaxID=6130 RepID=A0AAD9UXA6_ACRCE|nr:hypothetical protein P5673_025728 [Acropora cervicornis]
MTCTLTFLHRTLAVFQNLTIVLPKRFVDFNWLELFGVLATIPVHRRKGQTLCCPAVTRGLTKLQLAS